MQTTYTDAQIDVAAKRLAFTTKISYSEALGRVTDQLREMGTADLQTSWQQRLDAQPSDADIDAKARAYVIQHDVDYSTALRIVMEAGNNPAPEPTAEQLKYSQPGALERQLRAAHKKASQETTAPQTSAMSFAEHFNVESAADAAAIMQGQAIEIFRAGKHIAMDGEEILFTPADVQLMASNYDPKKVTAPLVIGHPDNNQPAYGWVKSLQATADGRLLMLADQINPKFAQAVKDGQFKKRSASFYSPRAYNNPAARGFYLRHVGWLGAQQPAIQGLADVQFA